MRTLNRPGRLAMSAVGLGIGAAMAATPGVGVADTLSADGGAGALAGADAGAGTAAADVAMLVGTAAAITPPTVPDDFANFAISISGIPLLSLGTATASSSFLNIAIADGNFAEANAMSGFFNYGYADGDHSTAIVGDAGSFNYASALGERSTAIAGGGNDNSATATGDYADAEAGALAHGAGGHSNTATAEGAHALAHAGWDGSSNNVADASGDNILAYSPALPPASALLEPALAATGAADAAMLVGTAAAITPPTVPGDFTNYAISISGIPLLHTGTATAFSSFGNMAIAHGDLAHASASSGLFNFASADGDDSLALAGYDLSGWFNSARVVGEYSVAEAAYGMGGGSGNAASVTGDHSAAYAGTPSLGGEPGGAQLSGNFNTATVEGTLANAHAGWDGSSNNVADASGDDSSVWSPTPPASAAVEPGAAITANDLFGDSSAATASGGDFWTELSNLF